MATLLFRAACASAQAAPAFPEVPYIAAPERSHTWAYVSLASGIALVGTSFALTHGADQAYEDYLVETDPARIETHYDRSVTYDRLASVSLFSGEVLLVGGLYLRFLRPQQAAARVSLALRPDRCALSWRF